MVKQTIRFSTSAPSLNSFTQHSRIETCGSPSDHSAPTADIESQSEDGKRQEISLSAKEPHSVSFTASRCICLLSRNAARRR